MKGGKQWPSCITGSSSSSSIYVPLGNRHFNNPLQVVKKVAKGKGALHQDEESLVMEEEGKGGWNHNLLLLSNAACMVQQNPSFFNGWTDAEKIKTNKGKMKEIDSGASPHLSSALPEKGREMLKLGESQVPPKKRRTVLNARLHGNKPENKGVTTRPMNQQQRTLVNQFLNIEDDNERSGSMIGAIRREAPRRGRGRGSLTEVLRCSRVNGRGWRCSQPTLVGYSLCNHHLGKTKSR